jgi:hypothetical protein
VGLRHRWCGGGGVFISSWNGCAELPESGTGVTIATHGRTDPFGPLASLVLREVLAEGEARGAARPPVPFDLIAARTGLHFSTVCRVASRIATRGYARRHRYALTLTDGARALDDWTLRWDPSAQVMASFHLSVAWPTFVAMLDEIWVGLRWAWTGVAGAVLAGLARGTPMHRVCYVSADDFEVACRRLERRTGALRVEDGGTCHVIVPAEARAQLYRSRYALWGQGHVVSTVQLLLDVAGGPDAMTPHTAGAVLGTLRDVLVGTDAEREPTVR